MDLAVSYSEQVAVKLEILREGGHIFGALLL